MILDDEDILIKDIPISNLETLIECFKGTKPGDINAPESLKIFMESKFERKIKGFKWAYSFGIITFNSEQFIGDITYGIICYKDGVTQMQLTIAADEQGKVIFDILGVDDKDIEHHKRFRSYRFREVFDI